MRFDTSGLTAAHQAEMETYLRYHRRRFRLLCDLVAEQAPRRVLDIGPGLQTLMLREELPDATIDTLGFGDPMTRPRDGEHHYEIDLNEAAWGRAAEGHGDHDVIVLAEVIEHLYTPPARVLRYVADWLRPGGMLIVTTPNAVALHKRLRMLVGRSPFEPIRDATNNPGHYHEYTAAELVDVAREVGLDTGKVVAANYFGEGSAYAALGRALPPSLRHGITATFRKPSGNGT